mgnify:CR=1 FL=1
MRVTQSGPELNDTAQQARHTSVSFAPDQSVSRGHAHCAESAAARQSRRLQASTSTRLGVSDTRCTNGPISAGVYATQLCSTTSFTRFAYSLRFSCHSRAASALAGEFGFGSLSSDWIEVRMAAMS